MFVKTATGALLVGLTGNLSPDGTNLVIFLDTKPGGETTLTDHGDRLSGNTGDTLPCPMDYAVVLNRANGNIYVDLYDLQTSNPPVNLGYIPDAGLLGGPLTGGDPAGAEWFLGVNMSNLLGVNDNPADDVDPDGAGPLESPQVQIAQTATTGFELSIRLTQIGLPANPAVKTTLHLMTMLTGNGPFRDISNQILPAGLGGGIAPFLVTGDVDVPTDLTNIDGSGKSYHCMEITLGHCNQPRFDADGDGDVDQDDFGAFQACYTGPVSLLELSSACQCFDLDLNGVSDGVISEADLQSFQRCAATSGPAIPADKSCDQTP
jgi:hypothetical protein